MKRLCLGLIVLFLMSCEGKKPSVEAFNQQVQKPEPPKISKEVLGDVIQSIPSPIEISMLIKDMGAKYDKSILNSTKNIANYNTNYKKALNLGVYSTDLGYANIYNQNQDALYYLNAVKTLADGLSIGQFFDFTTIRRLATNSSNLDSLLLITTQNFEKINGYLQEKDRSDQSILLLTGGWLEALYLTCEVSRKYPDRVFMERIGEQKVILDQLLLLLDFYKTEPGVQPLITQLTTLQKHFAQVEVTYVYKESTTKEVDGIITVVDNSTSKINVTKEDIDKIYETTNSIRKSIIN